MSFNRGASVAITDVLNVLQEQIKIHTTTVTCKAIEIAEDNLEIDKEDKAEKKKEQSKEFKPDWSKPFMSPYGKPIINIIRAYFMVGEFQIVKKFIVNSDCFDDDEFDYLLRNCSWGYEIDATNMKWQKDSTFLMTAKTNRNQNIGMEQYLGKIVNDTAKIFLFTQNKENPFVFYNKNPPADIQCQIESLARTINFEYNSSILTVDSKINLKTLHELVSMYSNLKFWLTGLERDCQRGCLKPKPFRFTNGSCKLSFSLNQS